jgi:hypothetical protein
MYRMHTSMVPTQALVNRKSRFEERRFLDALSLTTESNRSDAYKMSDVFDSGGAG